MSQAATVIQQSLAQPGMFDAFDGLAEKGLDQERLGFRRGNTARQQIEFQILVDRACRGAMAALHIVGEYLEFRLVIGLGAIRQQQGLCHHFGVGPLRLPPHDDTALEYAVGLVVEHRLEDLAALAVRCDVIDDQRGVGVLTALEQCRAADAGDDAFAVEFEEQLIAHHGAAHRERKRVKAGMRADRGGERRDMQRVGALTDDFHMIDMGLVADEHFQRRIDLIVAAGGTFMALDHHGARTALDDDERTHEARSRLSGRHEQQMQRPLDGRTRGDADHRAVAHQCGIERNGDVACRRQLAEVLREHGIVARQRVG